MQYEISYDAAQRHLAQTWGEKFARDTCALLIDYIAQARQHLTDGKGVEIGRSVESWAQLEKECCRLAYANGADSEDYGWEYLRAHDPSGKYAARGLDCLPRLIKKGYRFESPEPAVRLIRLAAMDDLFSFFKSRVPLTDEDK